MNHELSQHGPSSDLRIADLPEDLRPVGERLKAAYHALAREAGLVNPKGEFEPHKLDDLAFVQGMDPMLLEQLTQLGDSLQDIADPLRREFEALSAGIQAYVPFAEFRSAAFVAEAASQNFTPFQWAGVRTLMRLCGGIVAPSCFIPKDERELLVGDLDLAGSSNLSFLPGHIDFWGDLNLSGCISLATLPDALTVTGNLNLQGCTSLTGLPDALTVTGNLYLFGCNSVVKGQGMSLKNQGKIGGVLSFN